MFVVVLRSQNGNEYNPRSCLYICGSPSHIANCYIPYTRQGQREARDTLFAVFRMEGRVLRELVFASTNIVDLNIS